MLFRSSQISQWRRITASLERGRRGKEKTIAIPDKMEEERFEDLLLPLDMVSQEEKSGNPGGEAKEEEGEEEQDEKKKTKKKLKKKKKSENDDGPVEEKKPRKRGDTKKKGSLLEEAITNTASAPTGNETTHKEKKRKKKKKKEGAGGDREETPGEGKKEKESEKVAKRQSSARKSGEVAATAANPSKRSISQLRQLQTKDDSEVLYSPRSQARALAEATKSQHRHHPQPPAHSLSSPSMGAVTQEALMAKRQRVKSQNVNRKAMLSSLSMMGTFSSPNSLHGVEEVVGSMIGGGVRAAMLQEQEVDSATSDTVEGDDMSKYHPPLLPSLPRLLCRGCCPEYSYVYM